MWSGPGIETTKSVLGIISTYKLLAGHLSLSVNFIKPPISQNCHFATSKYKTNVLLLLSFIQILCMVIESNKSLKNGTKMCLAWEWYQEYHEQKQQF